LLLPERDRERFAGRHQAPRHFTGSLHWFTPALFKAFLAVRPKRVVIVCGLAFDHANVVAAAHIASRLLGCGATLSLYIGDTVCDPPPLEEGRPVWLEIPRLGLLAVLAGLLCLLRPVWTVRVGRLYAHRIGHLALDCEIHLCERDLGACPPRSLDLFYPEAGQVANAPLLSLFSRHMHITPLARHLGEAVDLFGQNVHHEVVLTTHQITYVRDAGCVLTRVPPHLSFNARERRIGKEGLARLGVPEGVPHVCLLGRDPCYLAHVTGPLGDGDHQWPRNMDIKTFREAALALTERGYAVIRMGNVVAEPLGLSHPLVFDYAVSDLQDPFLDIYFAATCRFFVGTPSGLIHIPALFRLPCVFVNLVRLEFMSFCSPKDITLFKRFRRVSDGRLLSVAEIVDSGLSRRPIEAVASDTDLEILDVSAVEIREAVVEMHERLDGNWQTKPGDAALQEAFRSHIPQGEYNARLLGLVGADFLRRHRNSLLPGYDIFPEADLSRRGMRKGRFSAGQEKGDAV
jgi:putative glycosyltransferase (TIGR04372 family)